MSDNATPVIVEPESPSSPKTLIADVLLLGLEYLLLRWLLKKWNEFQGNEGPPTRRCAVTPTLPAIPPPGINGSGFVFVLGQDYFDKRISHAKSGGYQYATFHLKAQNPLWPAWAGWNWNVHMRTKDGSTDASTCWLWHVSCPGKHFLADPDDETTTKIYWTLVCGCPSGDECTGDNPGSCEFQNQKSDGIFSVFFQNWKSSKNALLAKSCSCPHQCITSSCCLKGNSC